MGGKTAIADFNDVAHNGRRVSLPKPLEMASDTTVSETVRLAAIREALDRAELAAQTCAPSSMAGQSVGNPPASGFRALRDGADSILGVPIHPVREFCAFKVAIGLRALHTGEFAAEATQERGQTAIDQVQ